MFRLLITKPHSSNMFTTDSSNMQTMFLKKYET